MHGTLNGELFRPERVAYMAQSDLLLPWADVRHNVTLGARLRGEGVDWDRADGLIEAVGLSDHRHKTPPQLSGGMRQRVALARTLMEDAELVLLDEPFSALDARTRADMQALAYELLQCRTKLLVTHDPAEAARLGHIVHILSAGGSSELVPPGEPLREHHAPDKLAFEAQLFQLLGQVDERVAS